MENHGTMKDYLESLKKDIVDFKNPTCNNCNECCSLTSMITIDEYKQLKKYLTKDPHGKRIYKDAHNKLISYRDRGIFYMICPFSAKSKRCAIYNIRPAICRDFHCSPEFNKITMSEKISLEKSEHYTIADLFNLRGKI